jgi:heme o synthase
MNNANNLHVLRVIIQLGKPHITLAVSLSALTGFLLYSGSFSSGWLPLVAGIFLLSFSSAAINQIQERKLDALMHRTKGRPLPSGRLNLLPACVIALVSGMAGACLLFIAGGVPVLMLGLSNLVLYNLIYTYLKRVSIFAVVPGSLVGAIPPLIGWITAGGDISHAYIILVATFFFIGQIPHTWLILLRYDDEYKKAGFPSLTRIFGARQIGALTFVWVAATALSAILLSAAGVFNHAVPAIINMFLALLLLIRFGSWLHNLHSRSTRPAFVALNLMYLLVMLLLIGDSLWKVNG